jgi:phosphoribosylaminoimidazole-succinocarboxamide synthase
MIHNHWLRITYHDSKSLVDSFNKLNIEFTIQTILYGSETSDYNQNVQLFRAVHSFIKRSKRFDNNIVI